MAIELKVKQIAPGMFNGWTDGAKVVVITQSVANDVVFTKQVHGRFDEQWFVTDAEDAATLIQTRNSKGICTFYVLCALGEVGQIRECDPKIDIFFLC